MTYFNLLGSGSSANLLVNLTWQLIVVSILGIAALKLLAGKSAPVRSLVSSGILASLLLVFVASAVFHFSGIAWYKADVSRIAEKLSVSADKPLTVTEQTQQESVIHEETEPSVAGDDMEKGAPRTEFVNTNKFRMGACHFINVLGLIWAGGTGFLLLKLCYEMAFLRGFRFGLVKVSDEKFERLLKTAAGVFNKKRPPELYTSPKMESPITTGLLNPVVIIPEKLFGTLSGNELKSILLHELAHIYSYDHIIGVFKRIVIAANWWNPAVHIISAGHSIAREEASDNYVLLELNPKAYSECLAGLAEKVCLISSFPATAGMAGKYSSLEQRVRNILSEKRKLIMKTGTGVKLATTAICCILALFVAGCGLTVLEFGIEKTPEGEANLKKEDNAKSSHYVSTSTIGRSCCQVISCAGETCVNTFNGNLSYFRIDLIVSGSKFPISVVLTWNSIDRKDNWGFGYGWRFNYHVDYLVKDNLDVIIYWGTGRKDLFDESKGTYTPVNEGVSAVLEKYDADKYRLTNYDGTKFFFENPVHKKVTRMVDHKGNTLSFTYNNENYLTEITDTSSGRGLTLSYTDDTVADVPSSGRSLTLPVRRRVSAITDNKSSRRKVRYNYDADGNMVRVTGFLENAAYTYDSSHHLTAVKGPQNSAVAIAYNTSGLVESISDGSNKRSFSYDTANTTTVITDLVDGEKTAEIKYVYEKDKNHLAQIMRTQLRTYDKKGDLVTITNADGNTTTYRKPEVSDAKEKKSE